MLLFVVSCLANVNLFVGREVARSTFVVASEEHDETAIYNLVDGMIAILSSLDNLILIEVAIEAVDGLLGTVIPAGIDPLVALGILPCAVDLGDNRLGEVVCVLEVNPVAFRL